MVIFISAGKLNYIQGLTYLLISLLGLKKKITRQKKKI